MMGIIEKIFIRPVNQEGQASGNTNFVINVISYESVSDEIGLIENKRIETPIFTGSIVECKAYVDLLKEGLVSRNFDKL